MPAQPSVSGVQLLHVVCTGARFVATATALDTDGGVFLDSLRSFVASDRSFAGFGPYAAAASPSVVVAVGLDAGGPETDQGFPGAVWRKLLP